MSEYPNFPQQNVCVDTSSFPKQSIKFVNLFMLGTICIDFQNHITLTLKWTEQRNAEVEVKLFREVKIALMIAQKDIM